MARFCTLASGSSGNSTYISQGGESILIDAGISCRAAQQALDALGVHLKELKAVFLTHEHIDHVKGLKRLLRQSGAALYASAQTLDYVTQKDLVDPAAKLFSLGDGGTVELDCLKVTGFSTPHDSVGSLGYRVETSDEHRMAVATDLGCVTPGVARNLAGCDLVMIEANYDVQMLQTGSYPYYLKRRIAADTGHLSNPDCAALVCNLALSGTSRFVLAHLSRENNLPALADSAVCHALESAGLLRRRDYLLWVAPRLTPGELVAY